jgi:PAS domain S-box-containing protein
MGAVLSHQRFVPAIAAFAVGIAATWLTKSPLGLLAPTAAFFLFARGRAVPLFRATLAIGLVGSALVAAFHAGAARDVAVAWAAFFALALCIGAIVAASASASLNREVVWATIQSIAGEGTLSNGNGRFDDRTGATLDRKSTADGQQSLSVIHPDDRLAAAHAAARAFWTGVPQVTRHRRRQADGSYRWTETRSEPGYSVSVDIDDLVTEREPQTTTASNPSDENEGEAIRSARVIESLFGNGWAFDAAGRWIYLHSFAQNSLGVTLEDLNAPLKEGHTAWKRLLHPDDYDRIAAAWRHCLETGDHFNVEFRFRRATGIYVWARTAARPSRDSQGRITGWFGIALDVDVYKKTVAALRDRERELSQLVDMAPSHIWRPSRSRPTRWLAP